MGDAGEALIDAEDRAQQRLAEREEARTRRGRAEPVDPQIERERYRMELALADIKAQLAAATNPRRREQLTHATTDLESRLATMATTAKAAAILAAEEAN